LLLSINDALKHAGLGDAARAGRRRSAAGIVAACDIRMEYSAKIVALLLSGHLTLHAARGTRDATRARGRALRRCSSADDEHSRARHGGGGESQMEMTP
jgi:hypothetical protein